MMARCSMKCPTEFFSIPFIAALSTASTTTSCTKLFVAGLSHDTNETILRDAFKRYGEIIQVKVICDHTSSRSKGYGFVKFASETEAGLALRQMSGQVIDGREIHVDYAAKQ